MFEIIMVKTSQLTTNTPVWIHQAQNTYQDKQQTDHIQIADHQKQRENLKNTEKNYRILLIRIHANKKSTR